MDGQKKRVLIVDDMEINQQLAKAIVEAKDFEADLVMNGLEAVEALKKRNYDLILMDIQMPYMDGVQATIAIRAMEDPAKRNVPIIALTANGGEVNAARYLEAGMNDCICKPIDDRHLCSVMEKYTGVICKEPGIMDPGIMDAGLAAYGNSANDAVTQSGFLGSTDTRKNHSKSDLHEKGNAEKQLYDLRLVKDLSGGDMEFVKKMLVLFCDTMPANMKQLSCAADCGDWEATWKAAHKMKSTIDSMQIDSIRGLIREIEDDARKGNGLEAIPGKVRQVNSVLQQCMVQVRREL